MSAWIGGEMLKLTRVAHALGGIRAGRKRPRRTPALWMFTDAARLPDPACAARSLPRGAGIVFRAHGYDAPLAVGRALAQAARERGLVLLAGADPELAAAIGAAGVHLPERRLATIRRIRRAHPAWLVTAAAHSFRAIRRARAAGADAAFRSAVFPSHSPSAGPPIGPLRLALETRRAGLPVFALGGVGPQTARRLPGTGVSGFACVDAVRAP